MSKLRFSILTLLGSIALVALGCAAVVNANGIWAGAMLTLTIALLILATVNVLLSGRKSSFSIGFAAFGWIYLLIVFVPMTSGIGQQLLTTQLINYAVENWLSQPSQTVALNFAGPTTDVYSSPVTLSLTAAPNNQTVQYVTTTVATNSLNPHHVVTISQTVWTLLLAFVGGLLGVYLSFVRNRKGGEQPVAT